MSDAPMDLRSFLLCQETDVDRAFPRAFDAVRAQLLDLLAAHAPHVPSDELPALLVAELDDLAGAVEILRGVLVTRYGVVWPPSATGSPAAARALGDGPAA